MCVSKEYEIKKMLQEQWLQLKNDVLIFYWVELTFDGKGIKIWWKRGRNERIFGWWGGEGDSLMPPVRTQKALKVSVYIYVPKYMSCHKVLVVITGRAHCFHDCIYIYIYTYIYYICTTHIHIYIYIHTYILYILYIYVYKITLRTGFYIQWRISMYTTNIMCQSGRLISARFEHFVCYRCIWYRFSLRNSIRGRERMKMWRKWKFCLEDLQSFNAFIMLKAAFSKHWLVKLAWKCVHIKSAI